MIDLQKILKFILINTLGFFSVGICYTLGLVTGAIDTPQFNVAIFFTGTILTWMVCALFSVSSFFIDGRAKGFFLWAPVFVPFGYGLSVIFLT